MRILGSVLLKFNVVHRCLLWFLVAAFGAAALFGLRPRFDNLFFAISSTLPTLLPASYFALVIHELGHLIGGRIAGFQFGYISFRPIKIWLRQDRKLVVEWDNRGPAFGSQVSVPQNYDNIQARSLLYMLGGPVASFAFMLLALGYLIIHFASIESFGKQYWEHNPLHWHLTIFAIHSVSQSLFFFLNLIPIRIGGLLSDGGRIQMLLNNDDHARRWLSIFKLYGLNTAGVRPRDWPSEVLNSAIRTADGSADATAAQLLGYYAALDAGDIPLAERRLGAMLTGYGSSSPGLQAEISAEAAYFQAHHLSQIEEARRHLQLAASSLVRKQALLRAKAAVLSQEQKRNEALYCIRAALTELTRAPIIERGISTAEKDLLFELQRSIHSE